MNRVLFSSASDNWSTPVDLYNGLLEEFRFNFDPCPLHGDTDGRGMFSDWKGKRVFCNPPYNREIRKFLERAWEAETAVFLLPARTDTRWFHELVLPRAREIRFIKGRLKFGGCDNPAPFPSMVVVFGGRTNANGDSENRS